MLTTKYVKENLDAIRQSLKKRRNAYPVDELLKLDVDAKKMRMELQSQRLG